MQTHPCVAPGQSLLVSNGLPSASLKGPRGLSAMATPIPEPFVLA